MSLKDNLRNLREKAGYTNAKDFAQNVIKVPYSSYLGYETKGTWPNEETLCKIADALHVTTDELLGYEVDKQQKMSDCLSRLRYKVTVLDGKTAKLEREDNLYPALETTISNLLRMYDSAYAYSRQGERKKLLDFFACLITMEAFHLRVKKMAQQETVSKQDGLELYTSMLDMYSMLPKELYLAIMEKLKEKDPKGYEEMKGLVPVWKVREEAERSTDDE